MMWAGLILRCATRVAMRRISWIDQRISGGWAGGFWGWGGIGLVADRHHHGEGEHDQRDMAMPSMPGAGLVVVEAEFVFGGFEAVLDCPAMAFHLDQCLDGRALRAPCGEEGEIAVGYSAAD